MRFRAYLSFFLIIFGVETGFSQFNVDDYGAVGNGITDDTDSIEAAINAAGVGGLVEFTAGKIYRSCRPVQPKASQVIDFHGAILKRCDEIVTSILSYDGSGNWSVQDASDFEIGQWISVSNNGGLDVITGAMQITGISGNQISSWPSIQEPSPNSTMTTDSPFFRIRQDNVTIQNFVMDGNYPNNDTIMKWDSSYLVTISGENTIVQNGKAFSIPGDFLHFNGGSDGSILRNVETYDAAGAFVHLSGIGITGTEGIFIEDNKIYDYGKEYIRMDHAFGAIEWSDYVGSVYITGNYFDQLPYPAINLRDDPTGVEVYIRDNFASRTEGFINLWKYEADPDGVRQEVEISGNTLWNTKRNYIQVGNTDEAFTDVKIFDNKGENTYWEIKGIENFEFTNNTMVISDLAAAGLGTTMDWFFAPGTLTLRSIEDAVVDGNEFEGNWRQISFENRGTVDGFGFTDRYSFTNNEFSEFLYSGLQGRAARNGVGEYNEDVNWSTSGNIFKSSVLGNGTGVSPSGFGVIFSAGGSHDENCIEIDSPATDTYGARVHAYVTATSPGDAGDFSNNTFSSENGQAAIWGVSPQLKSLASSSSTVSDNATMSSINGNSGNETGTTVDSNANCNSPSISSIPNGPYFQIQEAVAIDYGDLPECYATTESSNGASHDRLSCGPILGSLVDFEDDGERTNQGDGDDLHNGDDEDGVNPIALVTGNQACLELNSETGGVLDAFVDFGNDCSLSQSSDRIANGLVLSQGQSQLCFDIPASANGSQFYARFRITENGINAPFGPASDGEVEDYVLDLAPRNLDIKVMLSGAFDGGSMRTDLQTDNLLPLDQPFSGPPWNYAGTESVSSMPNDITDWVLLSLRQGDPSVPPMNTIFRRAGLLRSDGKIKDMDGTNDLAINSMDGDYFIVIEHRNHLSIMSSVSLALSTGGMSYNFTNDQGKVFGFNPLRDLGMGLFGMQAGDGDQNQSVTAFDFLNVWLPNNGSAPGYLLSDFNLDGENTAFDFTNAWLPSNGTTSQVPAAN